MTRIGYQLRQDISPISTVHIEDVLKENASLIIRLSKADIEIGRLMLEIARLKVERADLSAKLQDSESEVNRLYRAVKHQETQQGWLQRHPLINGYV